MTSFELPALILCCTDGAVYAWGKNSNWQMALGTASAQEGITPLPFFDDKSVASVYAGGASAFALTTGDAIYQASCACAV